METTLGQNYQFPSRYLLLKMSLRSLLPIKVGTRLSLKKDAPNLEAKLSSQESPRGWGLFLIKNMVDELKIRTDKSHHTVELKYFLIGGQDASQTTRNSGEASA